MKVSKSGLFLFELIVVIFLFTISSAICISIFAKSYTFSNDSENLTISSLKAETVAEVFKDSDGKAEPIIKALESDEGTHDIVVTGSDQSDAGQYTLILYYDKEWNNTDEHNSAYEITVKVKDIKKTTGGNLMEAQINVSHTKGNDKIFHMVAGKFVPNI